jgi:hypothetical protein
MSKMSSGKLDQTRFSSLEQIKAKGYADKHRSAAEALYLMGGIRARGPQYRGV